MLYVYIGILLNLRDLRSYNLKKGEKDDAREGGGKEGMREKIYKS